MEAPRTVACFICDRLEADAAQQGLIEQFESVPRRPIEFAPTHERALGSPSARQFDAQEVGSFPHALDHNECCVPVEEGEVLLSQGVERLGGNPGVRTHRGGMFGTTASQSRSAYRGDTGPDSNYLGLRPARAIWD